MNESGDFRVHYRYYPELIDVFYVYIYFKILLDNWQLYLIKLYMLMIKYYTFEIFYNSSNWYFIEAN